MAAERNPGGWSDRPDEERLGAKVASFAEHFTTMNDHVNLKASDDGCALFITHGVKVPSA
jgi:hypothetical protein